MATLNPTSNTPSPNLIAPKTTRSLLQKNILWSLLGRILPMGIALFTIPLILKGMGTERYGVLSVVWMVIGYANLFDFGLGRALTQLISFKLGKQETEDLPTLIWTTIFLMVLFGSIGGLTLFFIAPFIVTPVLKVSPQYREETILAIRFLAFCIPVFFATSAFSGVLSSFQKFKTATLLNIPLMIFNYFLPLLMFPFTHNLAAIVMGLVAGRTLLLFANAYMVARTVPGLFSGAKFNKTYVSRLFSFGGWMTVSNIISPVMESFDRLLIANMLTASMLAFYTTPFDVVSKLLIIPSCIINVLFPAFTTELALNSEKAGKLFDKSVLLVGVCVLVPVVMILIGAPLGISWWITPEFSLKAAPVAQILAVGILFNALAFVPYALIQAKGHPDVTAKFHLLELPLYIGLLWLLVTMFGLVGAAWAWTLRVLIDAILLYGYAYVKVRRKLQ